MKNICLALVLMFSVFGAYSQTISGVVIDEESLEALPFALIQNLATKQSVSTDAFGEFTLSGTYGIDTIEVRYLGYETSRILAEAQMVIVVEKSAVPLDEIVVSTSRERVKRTETPVAISSISATTISKNKPTSTDQVLNQVAGVYMVDLGNEQHTMSIRRPIDYGASYLYLEDGLPIRASGVFNHNALLEINMANTKKIELVRGPSSSMYGSEAIGGAVNFISYKPSHSPTAGISLQGNSIGYKRLDTYASNTFGKLGVRFAGYYADRKNGYRDHSDFSKLALSLSATYQLSEQSQFVWSNTFVDYYADMTGSLDSTDFYDQSYSSNHTFTNRDVMAFRSKLAYHKFWNDQSKTSVTGYYRNNSIKQNPSYRVKNDFKPWIPAGNPNLAHGEVNDNSFQSFGVVAQHRKDFNWKKASIIGGASLDYSPNDYQASYISIEINDRVYTGFTASDSLLADYQADLLNMAAYLQGKIELVSRLNLIAGIRYDNTTYEFDNNLPANAYTSILEGRNRFSRLTPKIGLTYDLMNNNGLYANFSQGFVPPQVTELYRAERISPLKPVHYNNYELGGWFVLPQKIGKVEVSVFRMDGANEIISVRNDDGSTSKENAGETRHQGIEYTVLLRPIKDLAFRWSGSNIRHTFLDYLESGFDYSGKEMALAPKWTANAQLSWEPSFVKGFRTSVEWQMIDRYYMDAANAKEYSGYQLFNIRAGYSWKALELWVNLLNVTNTSFATVASSSRWGTNYSPGNPRNLNVGLAYKFSKTSKK